MRKPILYHFVLAAFLVSGMTGVLCRPAAGADTAPICRTAEGWYVHPDATGCLVNDAHKNCAACARSENCAGLSRCSNISVIDSEDFWYSSVASGEPSFECGKPDGVAYAWTAVSALQCDSIEEPEPLSCPEGTCDMSTVAGQLDCQCCDGYHNVSTTFGVLDCRPDKTCPPGYHSTSTDPENPGCVSDVPDVPGAPCASGQYNASTDPENPQCELCPLPNGLGTDSRYGDGAAITRSDGETLETCTLPYVDMPFWEDDTGYFEIGGNCFYSETP